MLAVPSCRPELQAGSKQPVADPVLRTGHLLEVVAMAFLLAPLPKGLGIAEHGLLLRTAGGELAVARALCPKPVRVACLERLDHAFHGDLLL